MLISIGEFDMGVDYNFPIDICCPNCDWDIRIDVMASEYPVGALEFSGANIDGAEYTKAPAVEIEYEPDEISNEYYGSSYKPSPNEMIESMSSREFELFVGSIFVERGFSEVIVTQRTRDGGFDFEVHDNNHGINNVIIGECKHFDLHRHVGVEIVRGFHDTQLSRHANKAIIVTSSYFTRDACELAQQYRIDLWDISFLVQEGRRLNLF